MNDEQCTLTNFGEKKLKAMFKGGGGLGEMSRHKPKMLTTSIICAAFVEKMKQIAEEGHFIEYKF